MTDPAGDPKYSLDAGRGRWDIPVFDWKVPTLARLSAPFEDHTGTDRPLWRDVSSNQGNYNPQVSAANGVHGVVMRAGISWGTPDPRFAEYWSLVAAAGIKYRTSYHVLYTDQPIDDQLDLWYGVHPTAGFAGAGEQPIPRVIDLQVNRGDSYANKASAVWNMSNEVLARDGRRPMIYSRRLIVDAWLASWSQSQLDEHFFWLAQYLTNRTIEHPGPPTLPNRVGEGNVVLHQTADKKPGFPGEHQSAAIDWDRWEIGDAEEMHNWIVANWGDEPDPDPTLEERVTALEKIAHSHGPDPG